MSTLAERVAAVRARMAEACARVGREPGEVALVAVAKRKPAADVIAVLDAGVDRIAENYVQEAAAKVDTVAAALAERGRPAPCWHFIGQLQRNKAKAVAERFDCVESVDRASLARTLDARAAAAGRILDVLLQVNLSGEAQKGGVAPEALADLLAECAGLSRLRVVGLMGVPAQSEAPEASREAFARLRTLRDDHRERPGGSGLRELSMGMSADFEIAIEEGATLVRVGTALFGPRDG